MLRTAATTILLALLAAGCGPTAPPDPAPPPPAVETRELSLDDGFITIRVDIPREPPGPKPAVVTLLGERERMLEAGLVVIEYRTHWEKLRALVPPKPAPAPPAAGAPAPKPARTWGAWMLASPTPKTVGRSYFRVITADATKTIPKVLDAVLGFPEIDATRVGITGTSTNGFIALQAIAHDPRLTAAAVIAACGDYHRFLHGSSLGMKGEPLDLDPEYSAWLRSIEPVRHPEQFVRAAVLLLNGSDDVVIPTPCVRATERAFAPAYRKAGAPERFRSIVVPGAGHDLSAEARHQVLAWWLRWLLKGRP
jgi:dienelactone hydrolase